MRWLAPGLAAAAFLGAGGRPSEEWRDPRAEWEFSAQGTADEARLVVRDAALWAEIWRIFTRHQEPRPPVPEVDFSESMLIVAARGECASGGYGIEFVSIEEGDREIVATVREIDPGPGAFVTLAITYPVAIALYPATELPVRFVGATGR